MTVYRFDNVITGDGVAMKEVLGGKGSGLVEMTCLGLPVPPGFTIPVTEWRGVCERGVVGDDLTAEIVEAMHWLEQVTGKHFGVDLFVSVRSGAQVFMPGQMDTVLNVGLNSDTVENLAAVVGQNEARAMLDRIRSNFGSDLPVMEQLLRAVFQIFKSWNNERAQHYRRLHGIPEDWGTPCTIQAMVFGNAVGSTSGTGVAFSHDLQTGVREFTGEWLPNNQGEAVVSGARTPMPISVLQRDMPEVAEQLASIIDTLFQRWRHPVDLEYTIENGRLWILQAMLAKLAPAATVKVAVDMAASGVISQEEAIMRVAPAQVKHLLLSRINFTDERPIAVGLGSSPGAGCGKMVLSSRRAVEMVRAGHSVVLVAEETSPDDMLGISVASAVLTSRGGRSSHAAIVTRNLGRPSVVGCANIVFGGGASCQIGGVTVFEGDEITVDGTSGSVYLGKLPIVVPNEEPEDLRDLLRWADKFRLLQIRVFANDANQAAAATASGVEAVLPTEYTFLGEAADIFRRAILTDRHASEYSEALEELLQLQASKFDDLFAGVRPNAAVMVRLLDPPLHEFLVHGEDDVRRLAVSMRVEVSELRQRIRALYETNPMLGHRGCRLGVTHPEIYRLQINALCQARRHHPGGPVHVLVPLVVDPAEMAYMVKLVREAWAESGGNPETELRVGAMIETPRACILADEIAVLSDFLVIGTSDLTQGVWNSSRDDTTFLARYLELGLWPGDPASMFDQKGVGQLVDMAVKRARVAVPNITIEMVLDETSVGWFHRISGGSHSGILCTIPQIRSMRLLAAQAALS